MFYLMPWMFFGCSGLLCLMHIVSPGTMLFLAEASHNGSGVCAGFLVLDCFSVFGCHAELLSENPSM